MLIAPGKASFFRARLIKSPSNEEVKGLSRHQNHFFCPEIALIGVRVCVQAKWSGCQTNAWRGKKSSFVLGRRRHRGRERARADGRTDGRTDTPLNGLQRIHSAAKWPLLGGKEMALV